MRALLTWIGAAACLAGTAGAATTDGAATGTGQGATSGHGSEASEPADPVVITLSTPAAMPAHSVAFRLTHRFFTPIDKGSFSDQLSGLFGLDGGAQIGLELRYGLTASTQLAVYRTSDRTIAFLARQELLRQRGQTPSAAIVASVEGLDNFSQEYSPRIGVALARTFAKRFTLYAEPAWIGNTSLGPLPSQDSRSTLVLGLGGRLRLAGLSSLVAEWTPRLAGYKGQLDGATRDQLSFGIATDVGGHSFQLNISNNVGTTPAQVARGQQGLKGWYLGFNLVRRFY